MSKKDVKIISTVAIIILIIYLLLDIKCPFRQLLKIPCAGCGMTRAIIEAMKFNFKGAFYYHPLFFLIPFLLLFFVFSGKLSNRAVYVCLSIFVSAFMIVYFIRLYMGIIP